ncbi:TetR/AcrR family transcriptional regulator [Komagataeibacter nataicola]|uniref:TetR/AcrR family transcriptional regulator n=1 Tax=Komagataeibacter rhaeticus TaxID=215221 RepID=A0A858JI39_9PROT|nr:MULTISPECIES: TetR/AcrR family transcriptional regulator [Komagataeibacter]QIP36246.1 TetR/AcrR family transcriptional regulator [Komagataeibacter rhaeticus]QOC46007.1 TetR/AcrR family transcriptional regulator [Komagataeibacter rhaeticus]WEQ55795.1 TetR/AcrR family transcriptional regulator [Komagataeibacter nataicola]
MKASYDDIVIAARELFRERGYAGASMQELGERVGLKKSSLYNRLPSKESLVADVLELTLKETFDGLPDPVTDWRQAYRELIERIAAVLGDRGRCVGFHLSFGVPAETSEAKAAVSEFFQALRSGMAEILDMGGVPDAKRVATDALTRLQGATLWLSALGEAEPLRRETEAILLDLERSGEE